MLPLLDWVTERAAAKPACPRRETPPCFTCLPASARRSCHLLRRLCSGAPSGTPGCCCWARCWRPANARCAASCALSGWAASGTSLPITGRWPGPSGTVGRAVACLWVNCCKLSCRPGRCCLVWMTPLDAGVAGGSAPRASVAIRCARRSRSCKASGPRWPGLKLLAPHPWTKRVGGYRSPPRNLRYGDLADWTRQVALQARRWLPERMIVPAGDSAFAMPDLLAALARHGLIGVTRLRLDAALCEPAPPHTPGDQGGGLAQEGIPPADAGAETERCHHRLAVGHRHRLEWHAEAPPGDLPGDRGVVPQRATPAAGSLGA